ncbi:site-specific integrase [Actinoplanes sp. NPDC048796]|uniref:tyrosine-type recombinase/integrase n=1 Tax=Actinoplanes sp. NPDC048796 TaxID=3155640 RepID=UPI0033ECF2BB
MACLERGIRRQRRASNARGMAHVTKRGTSFCLRWRFAGRQQCCTFRGPSDAKAAAAKQFAEAQQHKVTSSQVYAAFDPALVRRRRAPLLRDWIERWLELKIDVSPATHAEYARILRTRVTHDLGALRVDEITRHEHLDPWKAALARELMPTGVKKHWTVLSQVMRDAVPHLRADNPLQRLPGRRGNGLPRELAHKACLLSGTEAGILIANCRASIRTLVMTALATGMRRGELLGLRVRDVDLGGPVPTVRIEQVLLRDGTFAGPKTTRSRRSVSLPSSHTEDLAVQIDGKAADELAFTAPDGGPWDMSNLRRRYWRPAVIEAQRCGQHRPRQLGSEAVSPCRCPGRLHVAPRFQDLRHSHVAYLIAAGWDFYTIQLRLGHASIKTTFDTYGHLLPHGEPARLAALDRLLPSDAGKPSVQDLRG